MFQKSEDSCAYHVFPMLIEGAAHIFMSTVARQPRRSLQSLNNQIIQFHAVYKYNQNTGMQSGEQFPSGFPQNRIDAELEQIMLSWFCGICCI